MSFQKLQEARPNTEQHQKKKNKQTVPKHPKKNPWVPPTPKPPHPYHNPQFLSSLVKKGCKNPPYSGVGKPVVIPPSIRRTRDPLGNHPRPSKTNGETAPNTLVCPGTHSATLGKPWARAAEGGSKQIQGSSENTHP